MEDARLPERHLALRFRPLPSAPAVCRRATIEVATEMHPPLHESRPFFAGSLILLIVPLAGCLLHATKQAAAPTPPKPAVVQPPPPEPPLSIPQTAVVLPSPQEVNPDAIPHEPAQAPPPEKTEAPPPARPVRRAATPQKPDTDPEPVEAPPTPAAPEQAPIQPLLSGEELKGIQNNIETRKHEIADKLAHIGGHLTPHNQALVERIKSFMTQSDEAAKRGDYSQADSLSERALALARELQGE